MEDAVSIGSLIVTALATVALAIYTYRLVDESRKQRELATRPDIGVYLEPGQLTQNLLYLVIRNFGQGSAHGVSFSTEPSDAGWEDQSGQEFLLRSIAMLRDGMEYLAPGTERRIFYGPYSRLPDTAVNLHVTYSRKTWSREHPEFTESFSLSRIQFEGLLHSRPYEAKLVSALESTAKHLRTLADQAKYANREE